MTSKLDRQSSNNNQRTPASLATCTNESNSNSSSSVLPPQLSNNKEQNQLTNTGDNNNHYAHNNTNQSKIEQATNLNRLHLIHSLFGSVATSHINPTRIQFTNSKNGGTANSENNHQQTNQTNNTNNNALPPNPNIKTQSYTCTLEKTIALSGRLYLTNYSLNFYSNLFGYEKRFTIRY